MSTSFQTSISRTHDFEESQLKGLRADLTLPILDTSKASKHRAFNVTTCVNAYMAHMPAGPSSWYTHTEWAAEKWYEYNKLSEMSPEEAYFWFSAYTHPGRLVEHKGMAHTSDAELRAGDYSEMPTGKDAVKHMVTQNQALPKILGANSYLTMEHFIHPICQLLHVMLPRETQIPTAIALIDSGFAQKYNINASLMLCPVPRDAEEMASLGKQARAFIDKLDLTDQHAAHVRDVLVTRYNLTDLFQSTIQDTLTHKHRLTSELMKIYYTLSEEAQQDFRKGFRAKIDGSYLAMEVAMNGLANMTTWLDIAIAHKGEAYWAGSAAKIHAPEAVKFFAQLAGDSTHRLHADRWLKKGGANTIVGLIPLLAHRGHAKETAVRILRLFKTQGHEELITSLADTLTDDTGKAQLKTLVLDWAYQEKPYFDPKDMPDWLKTITAERGALPAWLEDEILPAQFTKDGTHQLTEYQVQRLVVLLQAKGERHDHADEILIARKHLSRRELGQLSWTIFDTWLRHGAGTKQKWAYLAIGHFGTALEGQKVAPYLKIWPKQNKWRMAQEVLEVYRMIGTDGALMTLNGIAQKVRQKSVRGRAEDLLDLIAQSRSLTPEQLADRIIPDCDLDEMGRYVFDYGARTFTLAFDNELRPVLRDDARNKIVKSLPKPGKADDDDLAEDARENFKIMKKQIKEVVSIQQPRLESAMITARVWPGDEFKSLLIEHPLMTHFARRLLWGVLDKKKAISACFRIDEDNNVLNAEDEPFELADDAQVVLVHTLNLSPSQLETWGTVFGDYEIIPPFPQLNRPVYDVEPDEVGKLSIKRFEKLPIPGLSLKGFVEKESLWTRGAAEDAGIVNVFYCSFDHHNVSCVVDMERGFDVGGGDWSENGGLSGITFYKGRGRAYSSWGANKDKDAIKLEDVPKVVLSEVLYSLYKFTAKYE